MTLKEEIQSIIIDDYGNLQKILLLEKIADDYAIEFARWCDENSQEGDRYIDLLNRFKKEKGL